MFGPVPFTRAALDVVPDAEGCYAVWGRGRVLWVGRSGYLRSRLGEQLDLRGSWAGLIDAVIGLLIEELGRTSAPAAVRGFLSACFLTWQETSDSAQLEQKWIETLRPDLEPVRPLTLGEEGEVRGLTRERVRQLRRQDDSFPPPTRPPTPPASTPPFHPDDDPPPPASSREPRRPIPPFNAPGYALDLPKSPVTETDWPDTPGVYIVYESEQASTPLYVGIGKSLRRRWLQDHLRDRSGSSAFRRTLGVQLGLVSEKLRRPDRYYPANVEAGVTEYLRTCWVQFIETPTREDASSLERELIARLKPRLNIQHRDREP